MVDRLEGRGQALPPVGEQHQPGQPVGGRRAAALLLVRAEAGRCQEALSALELTGQPAEQPVAARRLVASHDRAAVRQTGEHRKGAATAVEAEQVQTGRRVPLGEGCRQRAQHRRAPAAGAAHDEQVVTTLEVERERRAALLGRQVDQPERHRALGHRVAAQVGHGDPRRQRWQPRAGGRDRGEPTGCGSRCVDDAGQVGGPGRPGLARAHRLVADPLPRQGADRHRPGGLGVTAHAGGLHQLRGAGSDPHDRPTRERPVDVGGVAHVDHVGGLGRVGDAQGDAQPGVGADVGADHAAGPLGRQHEVHAEGTAALRDADQPADELRQLVGQRGELVDHQDQPGDRRRRPGCLGDVLVVVGAAGGPEQGLAAAQLGAQRAQRPLGEVSVEVGDGADGVREAEHSP